MFVPRLLKKLSFAKCNHLSLLQAQLEQREHDNVKLNALVHCQICIFMLVVPFLPYASCGQHQCGYVCATTKPYVLTMGHWDILLSTRLLQITALETILILAAF